MVLLGGLLCLVGQTSAGLLEDSREIAVGLWEKTRESAGSAWETTLRAFRGGQEEDGFARLWDDTIPKLDAALTLEERHEQLPERSWFGEDQRSNQVAIADLLDEAIALLSIAPGQRYRERIRELEAAIRQTKQEIADYRQKRVSAPRDSLWQKTGDQYAAEIEERKVRLAEYRQELGKVRGEFATDLQTLGLEITDEQLEFLLSTVVGDNLIQMSIAFDNVKAITNQLEQLMVESEEHLETARRYYGMYTVLLKVLDRMHQQLIEAVDQEYLPEIDTIIDKTRVLLKTTRTLEKRTSNRQQTLAANREAQALTLRAATRYRDYLLDQARDVTAARKRLGEDIAIAMNTYETVKVSGELVTLMRSSQRLLDTLIDLHVPSLRTFENLEMKREFEKLTLHLKEGGAS